MFYQKILGESRPYFARTGILGGFDEHRHADLEFHYCISGSFEVIIDKKTYTVSEGEMAFISPMSAHSFPKSSQNGRRVLTVILGISFLREYFSKFTSFSPVCPIYSFSKGAMIRDLLDDTVVICEREDEYKELFIRGNLYKICALLLREFEYNNPEEKKGNKDLHVVANIDKALELIYYRYSEKITVEDAARLTGYGKSNFCKIFKSIVGDTFHSTLNKCRLEASLALLDGTSLPISQISADVGFGETKTFCRLFKERFCITPGEYRKRTK